MIPDQLYILADPRLMTIMFTCFTLYFHFIALRLSKKWIRDDRLEYEHNPFIRWVIKSKHTRILQCVSYFMLSLPAIVVIIATPTYSGLPSTQWNPMFIGWIFSLAFVAVSAADAINDLIVEKKLTKARAMR